MRPRRRPIRRALATATLLAAVVLAAGCTVDRPSGAGVVRYRDQVFANVTQTSDLRYGTAPDETTGDPVALRLDLFQPEGDTQRLRPAMIWIHGGSFTGGDKAVDAGDVPEIFARLGYVTAAINYRLASQPVCFQTGVTPACITTVLDAQHDAQAAVRWLRANAATYGIDPTRIAVIGGSAGAIIATTVGLHSEDVGTSGNPGYSSKVSAFVSFSGGLPGGQFASPGDSPGLFVHGTADTSVPFQWSADTTAAMLRNGVGAVLDPLYGAGHTPTAYHDHFVQQSDYFLYDFMDLAHAAGQPAAVGRAFDRQSRSYEKRFPALARALRARRRR